MAPVGFIAQAAKPHDAELPQRIDGLPEHAVVRGHANLQGVYRCPK